MFCLSVCAHVACDVSMKVVYSKSIHARLENLVMCLSTIALSRNKLLFRNTKLQLTCYSLLHRIADETSAIPQPRVWISSAISTDIGNGGMPPMSCLAYLFIPVMQS